MPLLALLLSCLIRLEMNSQTVALVWTGLMRDGERYSRTHERRCLQLLKQPSFVIVRQVVKGNCRARNPREGSRQDQNIRSVPNPSSLRQFSNSSQDGHRFLPKDLVRLYLNLRHRLPVLRPADDSRKETKSSPAFSERI